MAKESILVAASATLSGRLEKALAGHELDFVNTREQAMEGLARRRFSCIVLGVQFDESRMLELLEFVCSKERYQDLPVVCIIGIKGRLSAAALNAFEEAAKALRANAVLDMADFPDDDQGNGRLRRTIEQALSAA